MVLVLSWVLMVMLKCVLLLLCRCSFSVYLLLVWMFFGVCRFICRLCRLVCVVCMDVRFVLVSVKVRV